MTVLRQMAYDRIDRLSEHNLRLVIEIMDKFQPEVEMINDGIDEFLKTAGNMEIDEKAIEECRNRSMI